MAGVGEGGGRQEQGSRPRLLMLHPALDRASSELTVPLSEEMQQPRAAQSRRNHSLKLASLQPLTRLPRVVVLQFRRARRSLRRHSFDVEPRPYPIGNDAGGNAMQPLEMRRGIGLTI